MADDPIEEETPAFPELPQSDPADFPPPPPLIPPEPEPPAVPAVEFTVLDIDLTTGLASVEFANPYYSGEFVRTLQRAVLDEAGEPTGQVEDYQVDEDPNPPATKQIRVPLVGGEIDQEAWAARLIDQARGVRARMDAASGRPLGDDPG